MINNRLDINKAKTIMKEYAEEHGLRTTSQRETILRAFLAAGKHITVDELFNIIKQKNPDIGYATVHRNLKLMSACGIADEIKVGTEKTRFEPKFNQEHHDHLICMKCGRFFEVTDKQIEILQDKLARENNFIPVRHKLEIYGICRRCT